MLGVVQFAAECTKELKTGQVLVRFDFHFLSRVSRLMRDIDIAILSVRLSVRDVLVLDENGSTYCHSFFTVR